MKIRIMEFLFTDKWAFFEALIVLVCLAIVMVIAILEAYTFLRKFFGVLSKKPREDVSIWEQTPEIPTPPLETTLWSGTSEENPSPSESTESTESTDPDTIFDEYKALTEETQRDKEASLEGQEPLESSSESTAISEEANWLWQEAPWSEWEQQDTDFPEDPDLVGDTTQMNQSDQETSVIESEKDIWESSPDNAETKDPIDPIEPTEALKSLPSEETEDNNTDQIPVVGESAVEEGVQAPEPQKEAQGEHEEKVIEPVSSGEIKNPEEVTTQDITIKDRSDNETISAIVNTVKTLIARKETTEARTLIIQWLALDKHHKDLNILLWSLYENERQFEKAEYVYKDLAMEYPNNLEILEKLWNVLIIEKRYSIALEIYKKILDIGGETEGTLYILSHLCHEMNDASEGHIYMKKYLKQWPNNPEILSLMGQAEIELGKRKDAIETLKRLKNLTPYNEEITATLQKLMMEEELAGNFGEER